MVRKIITMTLVIVLSVVSANAQVKVFDGSLPELLEKAGQSNMDALVMVSASWCGPCRLFMKKMIPLPEMGEYINSKFVFGHYEIDKEDPYKIDKTYGVSAYPTFLILDSKGVEKGRVVGSVQDCEEMKASFEAAYDTPVKRLREEFAKDPVGKADAYIDALREEYRSDEIQKALDKLCGLINPADVISKYIRDIKFNDISDYERPLACAISNTESLFVKYGSMLENPITKMANEVMNHLGENNTEGLSALRSAISSYGMHAGNFSRFVADNGESVLKGDVPALLDQIKRTDVYGPQPRLTALFSIMRKTKSNKTIGSYKNQMRDVLNSINAEEKSDKNFMKNLWKYVE